MRLTLPLAALIAAVLACGVLSAATLAEPALPATGGRDAAGPAATADADRPGPAPAVTAAAPAAPAPAAPQPPPRTAEPPSTPATTQPPARVPVKRTVSRTGWRPYATVGSVTLHFPGDVVEVVGLHESGHDGAQPQQPVADAGRIGLMGSRARDTSPHGAADIVVDPAREVRSPVTGTVLRAGSYTLYCDHVDNYLVVEPDARPGWEVKVLHFEGLAVAKGDRVEAGVTVVGSRGRVLPFRSQVDKHTVAPHWPHLHIEVVDPSVPDRPSGGSCD